MRWSWKLGRVAGITIQVHWTFVILIVWVILLHVMRGAGPAGAAAGVALVLAVFACVVLHELGHALTAKRFGIPTKDITLLPIGGVARLQRMPEEPGQELLVAAAGPAVNVVIAGVLWGFLVLAQATEPLSEFSIVSGNVPAQLMWINVMLVAFNLLPAFPMDGGRMLRALLAYRIDYVRATQIAASIGQGMAILFGFAGLFGNPILLLIAIFVYLGAQAEAQQVQVRAALVGVTVGDAMMTRYRTLPDAATLDDAVEELLAGSQQDFPVLAGDRVAGMLLRDDLVKALKERGRSATVGSVARADCRPVEENDPLDQALTQMREGRCSALPVVRGGQVVGLLSLENVGELLMVHSALRVGPVPARPAEALVAD
jgi:Zn-dependent protease